MVVKGGGRVRERFMCIWQKTQSLGKGHKGKKEGEDRERTEREKKRKEAMATKTAVDTPYSQNKQNRAVA